MERYLGLIGRWNVPPGAGGAGADGDGDVRQRGAAGGNAAGLRREGVPILMDDFGSGYPPFSFCAACPSTTWKIDKGLVDDSTERPSCRRSSSVITWPSP